MSFLELHWEGARFAGVRYPVEVSRDMENVEKAIREIAADLWLERHENRFRAPKGFRDSFSLYVEEVKDGCTNTVLSADFTTDCGQQSFLEPFERDLFEQACDIWLEILSGEADRDRTLRFRHLDKILSFGISLRDSEHVRLVSRIGNRRQVNFDVARRAGIREKYGVTTEIKSLELSGYLKSLDASGKTVFKTRNDENVQIDIAEDSDVWKDAQRWFDRKRESRPLILTGDFKVNSRGVVESLARVENLEPAYPDSWHGRMQDILSLQPGWLDGKQGASVNVKIALWVSGFLAELYQRGYFEESERPGLYPLLTGGVQLEWDENSTNWAIEFHNDGEVTVEAYSDQLDEERKLNGLVTANQAVQQTIESMVEIREIAEGL